MKRRNDAGANQNISVIAPGARVVGDVHTTGVVQIGGNVVGNVRAERRVLVAKGGMVDGEIETPEAVVGGEVRGTVRASHRVDVQASATLRGTITTPRLKVEEGATLDVELCMSESWTLPRRPSHTQKLPASNRHQGASRGIGGRRCRDAERQWRQKRQGCAISDSRF